MSQDFCLCKKIAKFELAGFQWRNTRGQSWQQAAKMHRKDLISQGLLNVCDVNLNLVIRVEGTVHVTTDATLNKILNSIPAFAIL
ncbi:uncharacterized protein N7469_002441 [Penicillium citrinum]|uniref:Uncharacterized protein n=2 Tax=Penicillium TaxID=5073 RepID=A0A9W9TTI5_PENCI|nr:uncharacterized protein N7469_002441 [Penicillium citrinum]KAJ5240850.1 hypothetical protein N7469_002441 [Penicillium citrinum]KAJ5585842.1 hypothetical protein N7450_005629 [Penicillium hetheringtonii]